MKKNAEIEFNIDRLLAGAAQRLLQIADRAPELLMELV
jgi:hypothetical protein